ncbi:MULTISPECIES: hypothetical protein [unclassified Brevundimonas]|uniref:hypothetical protein n=1 Tax=unclassified Brevundimonas TaxID=2622653 RepID=UPI0025C30E5B|nr:MULTISPECIES: hypothetical protein [unclassified Brevundimonas]
MKIKTGLLAAAAVLSLAACNNAEPAQDTAQDAAQDTATPAVETDEQVAARVEASLSPLDYKLRQISCNEAISAAKRVREGSFTPELTAKVAAAERLDFIKLVRGVRELGADASAVNTAQRAIITLPQRVEDVTPEYIAQTEECVAIVNVEKAKQEAEA